MRLVFAGTGPFGIPCLSALVTSGLRPELVISQPDRPKGRRGTPTPPPLAAAARDLDLPLYQPERLNRREPRVRLEEVAPDVMVVIAYGQILRPRVLGIPPLGCVNVHGSLLPRHRGASPVQASILAGDGESGVTVMLMDEGLDSGPILGRVRLGLTGRETGGELHDTLAELAGPVLVEALRGLESGAVVPEAQDATLVTTCGLITKGEGRIDWTRTAVDLDRRVRAYHPWPGAHTSCLVRDKELRIAIEGAVVEPDVAAAPGTVVEASGDRLVVATGDEGLRLTSLKPPGKRTMDAAAFLRGYAVATGSLFSS